MRGSGANNGKRDRIGVILYVVYLLLLVGAIVIVGRIIQIQIFYNPDPKIVDALTPKSTREVIEPARGNILACDGRLLALSCPQYQLYMDCTVQKEHYASMKDRTEGRQKEAEWMEKAKRLSEGLAVYFPEKSAAQHYNAIANGRRNGSKYLKIGHPVDHNVFNKLKELPLFNEKSHLGGLIVEQRNIRQYPYGKLARRTIGFVRDNSAQVANSNIGIEGQFNYVLHGTEGEQWLRTSDAGKVRDFDRKYISATDGNDVRTTLNIDFQDMADRALRRQIEEDEDIEGACLVLMEVRTGAIRAMVNLLRDDKGSLEEISNLAIGRLGEPGSVFKTVTLAAALSDGYIKSLDETIPTNHGVVKKAKIPQDKHISDWEREHHTNRISYLDGFKISSNYVLATIAIENYASKPQNYMDKVYQYKLGEKFDFDLEGLRTPVLPRVGGREWSNTTLGAVAYGYSTGETPLHILTFYNAIAGKGRMMKPYLVEAIEKNGSVCEKRGPSVLNASVFRKEVADTLTRALKAVTEEGTAKVLKNAKSPVAGKTGTAQIVLENGRYVDKDGCRKNQGTFVGFFPADSPRYSVICVVYSKLSKRSFYGGTYPARAIKELIAGIVDTDPDWQDELVKSGRVPEMQTPAGLPGTSDGITACVPDLRGMGLKDAIWLAENSGFRCRYSGTGHVRRQTPAAGTTKEKDSIIELELK